MRLSSHRDRILAFCYFAALGLLCAIVVVSFAGPRDAERSAVPRTKAASASAAAGLVTGLAPADITASDAPDPGHELSPVYPTPDFEYRPAAEGYAPSELARRNARGEGEPLAAGRDPDSGWPGAQGDGAPHPAVNRPGSLRSRMYGPEPGN